MSRGDGCFFANLTPETTSRTLRTPGIPGFLHPVPVYYIGIRIEVRTTSWGSKLLALPRYGSVIVALLLLIRSLSPLVPDCLPITCQVVTLARYFAPTQLPLVRQWDDVTLS